MTAFSTAARGRIGIHAIAAAAALAAVLILAGLSAAPARASGCDTWSNTKGGSWSEGANWSTKAPPTSSEEACITEPGTYTVALTGSVTVKDLTVGAASGTQTLQVGSTCSENAKLAVSTGAFTIGADGVVTMTNADGCGNSVAVEASNILDAGRLVSEPAHGGSRTLKGNVANTGTIAINTATSYTTGSEEASFSNEGTLSIAEGKALSVGEGPFRNTSTGTISAASGGDVAMGSGTAFRQLGGTITGTLPVIVDDAKLAYSGAGEGGTIAIRGEKSTLEGTASAKQQLLVESTCSEDAKTETASFTNEGAVKLTNGDGCGNPATLVIAGGTFTNKGTLDFEKANGGNRTLTGAFVNTGTVAVNTATSYTGSLTNEGAVDVAESVQLSVPSGSTFAEQTGGNIAGGTSGSVLLTSSTFKQGAGTTSGTLPVILDNSALAYEGSGASTIAARGEGSSVRGTAAAGQVLQIQSTCGENAKLSAAAGFSNGGAITLTNGDGCGNNTTLLAAAGMTNTGTITTQPAHGGNRTLQGELVNKGTIAVNAATTFSGTLPKLTNEGAIDIAENVQLSVAGASVHVINGSGGSIVAAAGGNMFLTNVGGAVFSEGAGTTSGAAPVIVDDGTVAYEGAGASTIAIRGEGSVVQGVLSAGQTLLLQSTCSEHVLLRVNSSVTNGGAIVLTNGDGCGNNATVLVAEGATLTNAGSITTEPAHGGHRVLDGNIKNTGTIAADANTETNNTSASTITNEGTVALANGFSWTVAGKTAVANDAGTISATGSGVLSQAAGSFAQGAGKETGTQPVVLEDTALTYTGKGTGAIAVRGERTTLAGPINSGQTLHIQSTCGAHAKATAAAFTNTGTIVLTNGDGCGNNATLELGGATIENKGTITAEFAHGGLRAIGGAVKNEKTVYATSGATLKVSGSYTQGKKGTLKIGVASAGSYGVLAATSTAAVAGSLQLVQAKGFAPPLGQTFNVLTSSALTGAFEKVKSAAIKVAKAAPGRYYKPAYSATTASLVVSLATAAVSPVEGAPGSTVTVTGGGFLPNDKVKITFTDAKKVKTTLVASVAANASGEVSDEVTVPATAAAGNGTVTVTSLVTSVAPIAAYKVT